MNKRKVMQRRFGLWIGMMLLFVVLFGMTASADMVAAGDKNAAVSGLSLTSVTGQTYGEAEFKKGVTALFFGRTNCGLTQNMVFRAESFAKANSGVSVVFINVDDRVSLEETKQLATLHPSVFMGYNTGLWGQACSYLRSCGISTSGSIYYPVTLLVDSTMKIQYASTNMQGDLEANIKKLLDAEKNKQPETQPQTQPETQPQTKYKITYKLNGGKNAAANPFTYVKGKAVTLKNPTRKGYLFAGWYSNAKLTKKVSGILAGSTGTKTFYAKWKKVSIKTAAITGITSKKSGKVVISLKKLSSVKGYEIVTSTSKNFKKNLKKKNVTSLKNTLSAMPKGKTIYVKVRAYGKDSAGSTVYGKYSSVRSVKVKR